jgi:hypothetical protein
VTSDDGQEPSRSRPIGNSLSCTDLGTGNRMKPVSVKDLMAFGDRLGMTQCIDPGGGLATAGRVSQVVRWGNPWEAILPESIVLLERKASDRHPERSWPSVAAWSDRNITCAALCGTEAMTPFLVEHSAMAGVPFFLSRYSAALLQSRLIGLIREIGLRRVVVHGVLVRVSGLGVLITGASGAGKTLCGLALVARGGFWVADDVVVLEGRGERLFGRGHDRTRGLIALRGQGVMEVESLMGTGVLCDETCVDVVVGLRGSSDCGGTDLDGPGGSVREIVGVRLPFLDVKARRDAARTAERVLEGIKGLVAA